jgi:UMP-CMP kinase
VIDGGGLVPVELSLRLLRRAMEEPKMEEPKMEECRGKTTTTTTPTTTFLVDGFPRNVENLEGWERTMSAEARVLCVLVYDVGVEELRRRILERGETSGRTDDNVKAAEKRFRTFERETVPVIKRIEREGGWRVERLEGEAGPEEVWERTRRLMEEVLAGEEQEGQ